MPNTVLVSAEVSQKRVHSAQWSGQWAVKGREDGVYYGGVEWGFAFRRDPIGGPKVERGGFRPHLHLVCAFSFLFFLGLGRPKTLIRKTFGVNEFAPGELPVFHSRASFPPLLL